VGGSEYLISVASFSEHDALSLRSAKRHAECSSLHNTSRRRPSVAADKSAVAA
jgi:hypothetical protein